MKFLLDTNTIIDYLRGHPKLAVAICSSAGVTLSAIVAAEFYIGYHATLHSTTKAAKGEVRTLFRNYPVLKFDAEDGYETGRLITQFGLIKDKTMYRDVMIAAQAKKRGLTVITNNTGDFFRLAGLKVENWTL